MGDVILKKKAVVLFGSPHKNGHTKKALNNVLKTLENDYNFALIDAFSANIGPCIDCGFCKNHDNCTFDDFNLIDKILRESELLIIATPIYNLSLPAPLKAIFDRTQVYFNIKVHRKINLFEKEKRAILVCTYGSSDSSCEKIILKQLELFFILLNAKLCKIIFVKNTDNIKKFAN